MAKEALAAKGNFFHIYDFYVLPGRGEEFIKLFNEYDYSPDNKMHKSPYQVKDGVLCRDVADPNHFYLVGEWESVEAHMAIRKETVGQSRPFLDLVKDRKFSPVYAEIVSATPVEILNQD